jgi:hypothetical protein
MRGLKGWALAFGVLAAAPGWAQSAAPAGAPVWVEVEGEPGGQGTAIVNEEVRVIQAGEGFETRLVKGAPYQAETVTETVQTLADGNRIVQRTTGLVARDSEGRTRREQTLGALPHLGPKGGARTIFIHDSAGGFSYALEPEEKIARKMGRSPVFTKKIHAQGEDGAKQVFLHRIERKISDKEKGAAGALKRFGHKSEIEPMGTRTIEGVEATGTRTTITIPAGEIGNERDIEIVNERWESPELKVVVMSRNSDPRFGETTYKLTGLVRAEPDRSLFEVPSDYTVKEGKGKPEIVYRKKRPQKD